MAKLVCVNANVCVCFCDGVCVCAVIQEMVSGAVIQGVCCSDTGDGVCVCVCVCVLQGMEFIRKAWTSSWTS